MDVYVEWLNFLASKVNSVVVTVFELIAVPRLILPLTLATHLGQTGRTGKAVAVDCMAVDGCVVCLRIVSNYSANSVFAASMIDQH